MACLHPIRIKNPSKNFINGVSKAFIEVPCGKCAECRKANQQDWSTRAYIETITTLNNGGFTLFPTLTYDNEHLPYFDSDKDNGYHIPCFSKYDIDLFLNTLRKRYERKGIFGIKYLICSEFGEKKQRPHYHALIHFPQGCDRRQAEKDIIEIWKFGLVGWSPNGKEVISYEACRYVSKYVTKDVNYATRRDLSAYLHTAHADHEERLEAVKSALPRHWQSKGYGAALEKMILESKNPFKYLHDGYRVPLSDTVLKIPHYIVNKLCYEYRDGKRFISEFGANFKENMFDVEIEEMVENMKKTISVQGLKNKIDDNDVPTLFKYSKCEDIDELHKFLNNKLDGYNLTHVAIYQKVFRNTSYIYDSELKDYIDVLPHLYSDGKFDIDNLLDVAKDYYINKIYLSMNESNYELNKENAEELNENLFNNLECFRKLEDFCCTLQAINAIPNKRRSNYQEKQNKIIKKLKELYK